jgi:hypothetical protein
MNKNTRAKKKLEKPTNEGKACISDFKLKHLNPENRRMSPWRGCSKAVSSKRNAPAVDLLAT